METFPVTRLAADDLLLMVGVRCSSRSSYNTREHSLEGVPVPGRGHLRYIAKCHLKPISQLRFDYDTTIPRHIRLRRK